MKVCSKCKTEKDLSEFGQRKETLMSGKVKIDTQSYCKACAVKAVKKLKKARTKNFKEWLNK